MVASSDHEEVRTSPLEKLVIVAIVLLLVAIAVVAKIRLENARLVAQARADCKAWAIAVSAYRWRNAGAYPPSLATLTEGQADGAPPFMWAKFLQDPWGHEYQYEPPSGFAKRAKVWSWGPRMHDPNSIITNGQGSNR